MLHSDANICYLRKEYLIFEGWGGLDCKKEVGIDLGDILVRNFIVALICTLFLTSDIAFAGISIQAHKTRIGIGSTLALRGDHSSTVPQSGWQFRPEFSVPILLWSLLRIEPEFSFYSTSWDESYAHYTSLDFKFGFGCAPYIGIGGFGFFPGARFGAIYHSYDIKYVPGTYPTDQNTASYDMYLSIDLGVEYFIAKRLSIGFEPQIVFLAPKENILSKTLAISNEAVFSCRFYF
jgi:hypothetical protein